MLSVHYFLTKRKKLFGRPNIYKRSVVYRNKLYLIWNVIFVY